MNPTMFEFEMPEPAAPAEPTPHQASLEPSLTKIMEALGWEIELAGARCTLIDSVIGRVIEQLPADERSELLESLHAVDLLNQHLYGLAGFVRELSLAAPPVTFPVGRALAGLTLGVLTNRLSEALGGGETEDPVADDGDLQMF